MKTFRIGYLVSTLAILLATGCAHVQKTEITPEDVQALKGEFPGWLAEQIKKQRPETSNHEVMVHGIEKISADQLEIDYTLQYLEEEEGKIQVKNVLRSKALLLKEKDLFNIKKNSIATHELDFMEGITISVPKKKE